MTEPSSPSAVLTIALAVMALYVGAYALGRVRQRDFDLARDAKVVGLVVGVVAGLALLFSNIGGDEFRAVGGLILLVGGAYLVRSVGKGQVVQVTGWIALAAGVLLLVDGIAGLLVR